jgi:hypothetical protein
MSHASSPRANSGRGENERTGCAWGLPASTRPDEPTSAHGHCRSTSERLRVGLLRREGLLNKRPISPLNRWSARSATGHPRASSLWPEHLPGACVGTVTSALPSWNSQM